MNKLIREIINNAYRSGRTHASFDNHGVYEDVLPCGVYPRKRNDNMKKYMVVSILDGEEYALFFDTYSEAKKWKQESECGFGGYSEIYERIEKTIRSDHLDAIVVKEYVFLES